MTLETARLATIAHLARLTDTPADQVAAALDHLVARGLVVLVAPDRTPK